MSQKTIIQRVNRTAIIKAVKALKIGSDGSWLEATNIYLTDTYNKLAQPPSTTSEFQDFVQFICASAFVHSSDGWGYIGRAIDAVLRGDTHSAVHLTYYCQLRAVASLLACEGILFWNGRNYALNRPNSARKLAESPTHSAAWQYLVWWSESDRGKQLISEIVRSGSASLKEWGQNLGGFKPVVTDLLKGISFDLDSFKRDKVRRNNASYNPTRIRVKELQPITAARLVSRLWNALEPDPYNGFPNLDKALVIKIWVNIFMATMVAHDGTIDWHKWDNWIHTHVPSQSVTSSTFLTLKQVSPTSPDDHTELVNAAFSYDQSGSDPVDYIEGMMTRALILLRLSTGACINLCTNGGRVVSDFQPWIDSLRLSRGVWDPTDPPVDPKDLWADTRDATDKLDAFTSNDRWDLLAELGSDLNILGQMERAIIWNF